MAGIGRSWNGKIYGTNTGNVAVTFEGEDDALTGKVRLSDDRFGVAVYSITGKFDAGTLELTGTIDGPVPEEVQVGELTVKGALTSEGRLDGEWGTTLGTGGTFQLWPHSFEVTARAADVVPEQLNTSTLTLGAVRLYADDVRSLIAQLLKDFKSDRAVVTYNGKGSEKNVYSADFEAVLNDLPELQYLKISVQEPELYGINRMAMIELAAWGENIIRVQSVQEAWAIGKAETLSRHVQSFQRKIATQFRKFGLNINLIITFASLAALPDLIGFWRRFAFVIAVWIVQSLITFMHRKYVPNFILYQAKKKPGFSVGLGRVYCRGQSLLSAQ